MYGNLAEIAERQEDRARKAIPSRVYANHFTAIAFKIRNTANKYELKEIDYFNNLVSKNENLELSSLQKLLTNSWSTEYAFQIANEVNNSDYYKFSIHWSFPQAYYSVYLAMTAFHETQNVANDQHEKSIKLFGNSIKDNHYPSAISFFSRGLHQEIEYLGLETFEDFPEDFSVLSNIHTIEEAEQQIASFLKSTRKKNAEHKRERLEKNNDRRFHTAKGIFKKSFRKSDWDLIYKSIPQTTLCNILYRLRIKANYRDIETLINADINFKEFHVNIGQIVGYLNFVHEAYICKVIGLVEYEKLINNAPNRLIEKTARKRFDDLIKPLFE